MAQRPELYDPLPDSTIHSSAEQCLGSSRSSGKLKILVVDDNAANGKLLRVLLQADAHKVYEGEERVCRAS